MKRVIVFRRAGQRHSHRGRPRRLVAPRDGIRGRRIARRSRSTASTRFSSSTPAARPGKPKGILHTTGGYLLGAYMTCKYVFDLRDEDVYWCTADVGWVTGHSYVVYGPLANGATSLMYEGAPNWPDNGRFWKIIEEYAVTSSTPRRPRSARSSSGATSGRRSTISPRCACSARSASRSIPRRGCGITRSSAADAARSWTPGGRRKPAAT